MGVPAAKVGRQMVARVVSYYLRVMKTLNRESKRDAMYF